MHQEFHSAQLSEAMLCEAFPFHLVVNQAGCIVSCGRSLSKNIEFDLLNSSLLEHFTFKHPSNVVSLKDLPDQSNSLFLLTSIGNPDLLLRGQLVTDPGTQHYVFLTSPWVSEIDTLDKLGLSVRDFPVHNPLSDFLILLQAQKASLNDSQRLSDELVKLNKELEGRVERRTAALELKASELLESKTFLEHEMIERERVEIELRHAQKLESVGQLAAGIAHEINTPMQYIGNSLSFLSDSFKDLTQFNQKIEQCVGANGHDSTVSAIELKQLLEDADIPYICERAPKALSRAVKGIERVTEIIRAMNEFTHPDRDVMDTADINRALDTVLTVAENEYKYVAHVNREFSDIPHISCFLGDLNQVFLNLVVNAAHAIADSCPEDGMITLKTQQNNDWIMVSVSDNGSGIPEDIQHRVFDPFFTTKEVGKGTGQGLAISHKIIVEKHRGKLYFETVKNKGTTFHIALPITNFAEKSSLHPQFNQRNFAA